MASNHSGEHLLDEVLVRLDGVSDPSLVPHARGRGGPAGDADCGAPASSGPGPRGEAQRGDERAQSSVGVGGADGPLHHRGPHRRRGARRRRHGRARRRTARPVRAPGRRAACARGSRHRSPRWSTTSSTCGSCTAPRVADEFADLLVVWSQDGPITAARSSRSPSIGIVRSPTPAVRTGNHTSHGWAVAAGPRVDRLTGPSPWRRASSRRWSVPSWTGRQSSLERAGPRRRLGERGTRARRAVDRRRHAADAGTPRLEPVCGATSSRPKGSVTTRRGRRSAPGPVSRNTGGATTRPSRPTVTTCASGSATRPRSRRSGTRSLDRDRGSRSSTSRRSPVPNRTPWSCPTGPCTCPSAPSRTSAVRD